MAAQQAGVAIPYPTRITTLDCTPRDGGYYNRWQFSHEFAQEYLDTAAEAGVTIAEIGLRQATPNPSHGRLASSPDTYLEQLRCPPGLEISLMTNLSDILAESDSLVEAVHRFYGPSEQSCVSCVRVATHYKTVSQIPTVVSMLHDKGYRVAVNLMKVTTWPLADVERAARLIGAATPEVLYFADSLGNMEPQQVETIACAMFEAFPGEIGFHAHNNRSLALTNTLVAARCGVTWLDSTLMGMGRGAGNCPTECLLAELQAQGVACNPQRLHPFINDHMVPLMNEHNWGPNLLYTLGAHRGIHPTFIQNIIAHETDSKTRLDIQRMLEVFDQADNVSSFQQGVLDTILAECFRAENAPGKLRRAG